jgi:hypothetical protein
VWPNAGAIDTELPVPPERVHVWLRAKPRWVELCGRGPRYPEFPPFSIAQWHERHQIAGAPRRRSSRKATG